MSSEITIIDKALAATVLRFVPRSITPNQITIFRFLLIPFVIILLVGEYSIAAIVVFSFAAFTDAMDGAMARTRDQITTWGKLYDPLADKLLIGTVVAIVVTQYVGILVALSIILLELALVAGALYKKNQVNQTEIEAKKAGKAKMIFQSFGVGLLLLYIVIPSTLIYTVAVYLLYLAILFALLSLLVYKSI